jgi:hypothetical protein
VAAEDGQLDAEVLHVLGDDRGLLAGRPHDDRLRVGALDLGELGAHVGVARVEGLVGDDVDAGFSGASAAMTACPSLPKPPLSLMRPIFVMPWLLR